jgi:hypothetical protein
VFKKVFEMGKWWMRGDGNAGMREREKKNGGHWGERMARRSGKMKR